MATKTERKLVLPPGRLSYPRLFEKDQKSGKFQATLIWPEDVDLSDLEAAIEDAANEQWPKKRPANLRIPLKDNEGKVSAETGERVAGYENPGRHAMAWTRTRPKIVGLDIDPDTGKLVQLTEDDVYAGCWVRASVRVYAFHNQEHKTNDVILGLCNVQFFKDDTSFGGTVSDPDDDFGTDEPAVF
jgi:Protein of unknown function (DUF2815)